MVKEKKELMYPFPNIINYQNVTLDVKHVTNMVIHVNIIVYLVEIQVFIVYINTMKISQKVIVKDVILNAELYHIITIMIWLKNMD